MKLRTAAQLAEAIGLSQQTVRQAAADGRIPAARIGPRGKWLFDEEAVRQAIAVKTGRTTPEPAKGA